MTDFQDRPHVTENPLYIAVINAIDRAGGGPYRDLTPYQQVEMLEHVVAYAQGVVRGLKMRLPDRAPRRRSKAP